jgi:hypothetical protein
LTSRRRQGQDPLVAGESEEIAEYLALQEEFDARAAPLSSYSLQELRDAVRSARAIRLGLNGQVDGAGGLVSERERELARELAKREAEDTVPSAPAEDAELF